MSPTMRRAERLAVLSALISFALSCGVPSALRHAPTQTNALPEDAWADVVVGGSAGRDVTFAHDPAEEPAPPAAEFATGPAPIEILIGEAASGQELGDGDAERDIPSGWETEAELNERVRYRVPRTLHAVIDVPYQSWSGAGTFVHLTVFSPAFRPAAGAEVFLDGALIGRTERNGAIAFRRGARRNGPTSGTLRMRWRGLERELEYEAASRTPSFESRTIYVYTDRGVYSPGQTIEVRAIAWQLRGEYRPLGGASVTLELTAPDGRVVGGVPLRTDAWGIGTASLPLPAHAAEGPYRLIAASGEERANARLIVQPFVAPAIEVRHDLRRYVTTREATLRAEVNLGYFDGAEFERGTLRLTALRDERELTHVERDVQGPGPHTIELDEAAMRAVHRAMGPGHTLELALEVTDAHGRSDRVRRFVEYTVNPYRATLELDHTRYAPRQPVIVTLRLTDLDDVPIRDREVTLSIPRGRPAGWRGTEAQRERALESEEEVNTRELSARTDASGLARFRFPMPILDQELDTRELEASIDDVEGPIAHAELPAGAPLPMRSAVDETTVDEGASIEVEVDFPPGARPLERVVHADIVDSSGAIIHSALVPVRGRRASGRVRAPSWGSMLLTLYCVGRRGGEVGLMSDGQNIIVRPGTRIRAQLSGLPEVAAPGDHVRGRVHVLGPDGPRQAAVGLAVVDDAVLSLLDPLERPPFDRFYNPERKVLATTGAQTLTWPLVARTWGRDRYDLAWPEEFGWHGGPVVEARSRRSATGSSAPLAGLDGLGGGGTAESTIGLGNLGVAPRGPVDPDAPEEAPTELVLRTRFDETSLWLPRLVTDESGELGFEIDLPDAITTQRVRVVATDREGGVTSVSHELPVRQELYVRSDLPPALTEGDRVRVGVAVRNTGRVARTASVTLRSEELEIEAGPQRVEVGPEGTEIAFFDVVAPRPGDARYEVAATFERPGEAALRDVERRSLRVRPRGTPERETQQGLVEADGFATRFSLPRGDRYRIVRLGVAMPSAAIALTDLEELLSSPSFGPDPASNQALAGAAAYAYLERAGSLDATRRAELRLRLARTTADILFAQRDDGGWGWFWSGGESVPYLTVHALEALLELRRLGFPVPQRALIAARNHILGALDADTSLLEVAAIAPWEGQSERIRRQATAEAVHVLARLPRELLEAGTLVALLNLWPAARAPDTDPLTLAHLVGAMHQLRDLPPLEERVAELPAALRRLADIRRVAHWEPGWFSAWGGTVEAAALTLEVLAQTDEAAFEAARRDAVRFLLHTRRSFGGWHNSRGTAWAIRGLTLANPGVADDRGTLSVHVDGRELRRVEVNASDQMAAALALRSLELEDLEDGEHTLEVRYDGRMRPRVTLSIERWTEASSASEELRIELSPPAALRRGVPAELRVSTRAPAGAGPLYVELPLPPGVTLVGGAETAEAQPGVLDAQPTASGWRLGLAPAERHALALRVVASRAGDFAWPGATLHRALVSDDARAAGHRVRVE